MCILTALYKRQSTSSVYFCRGYNIGIRLIEDFLARTQQGRCYDLKETADILAKVRSTPIILNFNGF